ncbi:MAG: glutathione S-transferase N-terminal domain-containing protein [Pseudomonadota bacterium]|nr:glutathione S-transferase N-terminal domain-containing protein [Pseudomonadota bacterium]
MSLPTLYTFRRCPYAMRARWAIAVAGVAVQMHEVSLRYKPAAMLVASPKGTVPVLVLPTGEVIDESLDVMRWALAQRDPEGWLAPERGTLDDMLALIAACERDFKPHLDRAKYATRYTAEWGDGAHGDDFAARHFALALVFLQTLAQRLQGAAGDVPCLFGHRPALADFAIVPFVRQFARHDPLRVAAAAPAPVMAWMARLLARADFDGVMRKVETKA